MKKFISGIIIGIILTLISQYLWHYFQWQRYKYDFLIFSVVEGHIERSLDGAKVLDVTISPSSARVNYVYDKLYEANINYERDGKIKKIVTHYGLSGRGWITPNNTELEILDDKAEVIYEKISNE